MEDDTNKFLETFSEGPPPELSPIKDAQSLTTAQGGGLPDLENAGAFPPQENIPLPPSLIQGVLHQGSKMVLAGGSKSYKTWTLIDLAISVAGGGQWWGWDCARKPVFLLNLELQDAFFKHRVWSVTKAKRREKPPEDLWTWQLRGKCYDVATLRVGLDMQMQKLGVAPGLLVIDPIYKAFAGGNENDAGEVTAFLEEIEAFTVDTGAAVCYGAHFSKGNQSEKEAMDRISGSGVHGRDPDAILTMTKHAQEDCLTVEASLRDYPPVKPFVVEWDFPLFHRDDSFAPGDLKKMTKAAVPGDNEILARLTEPMTNSQWLDACGELCGEKTFRKYRDQIVRAGKANRWQEAGRTWFSPRPNGR